VCTNSACQCPPGTSLDAAGNCTGSNTCPSGQTYCPAIPAPNGIIDIPVPASCSNLTGDPFGNGTIHCGTCDSFYLCIDIGNYCCNGKCCPGTATCVNGQCTCPPGETLCHTDPGVWPGMLVYQPECDNLMTDPFNCGSCGNNCYDIAGFGVGIAVCCNGTCCRSSSQCVNGACLA
jgi:hypothetical protein